MPPKPLWTFGGLPFPELLRRTARECWHDAVFGQSGRMAFYQFLALFPALLVFLFLSSRVPPLSGHIRNALQHLSSQVLPDQVSTLVQGMIDELNSRALSGPQLLSVCAGALWAGLNGTWALIHGLNTAYEVQEHRSWRELATTIPALTLFLGIIASAAVFTTLCGRFLLAHLGFQIEIRALEWLVLTALLLLSFAVIYRFAPNLRDREWRWSTPGAVCALLVWIGSTSLARIYFAHVNDYSRSYGHLRGVVMLLLWFYLSNGSVLIGGEMNSEIEKEIAARTEKPGPASNPHDRSGP